MVVHREGAFCVPFSVDHKKVLLVKRRDLHIWDLPGGGIKPGETLEQATIREFEEETGGLKLGIENYGGQYEIRSSGLFQFLGMLGDCIFGDPKSKHRRTFFHDIAHVFYGTITGGNITDVPETTSIGYFDLQDLPRSLPRYLATRVYYATKGRFHQEPYIQKIGVFDILLILAKNPHLLGRIPEAIRKNLR